MKYDMHNFTYGFELEVGDVDRSIIIPPELGAWESSERDIVNLREPYRYVAADPLGISPPVGGEMNVYPSHTPKGLVKNITDALDLFRRAGSDPTFCCTTHSHVHIRVPGLRDDIEGLRRLSRYVGWYQADVVKLAGRFVDHPDMDRCPGSRTYMRYDGGRLMPEWLCDNLQQAKDFEDWIRIHCCGKNGYARGRPLRYAINTYCMKHIDTIEFRMFRSSGDPVKLLDCINFSGWFLQEALNDNRMAVEAGLWESRWRFPPMRFDKDEWDGLQKTKYGEDRGKKVRTLHDI